MFSTVLFVDSATHVFPVFSSFRVVQQLFNHRSRSSCCKHGSWLEGGASPYKSGSKGYDDVSPNGYSGDGSNDERMSDSDES